MRRSTLLWIFGLIITAFFSTLFIFRVTIVKGAPATHIVISEIQIAGNTTTTDEFVELYNPTATDLDLTNWQLTKKSELGTPSVLVTALSGTIKSHGFFLITSPDYTGSTSGDLQYSTTNTIAANNTVLLYSDAGVTLVDKVGLGSATDKETATTTNPGAGKSKERKAFTTSTTLSMSTGIDLLLGNGEDSDNNTNDFVLKNTPEPQNSNSSTEPVAPTATPTPTESEPTSTPIPSEIPTLTPTPTQPEPTELPTSTPTPTDTPTPTLTSTPTPTQSEPTSIPTNTPTPLETPTPAQVTLTPTPLPTSQFPPFHLSCTTKYINFRVFAITIQFPVVSCSFLR